MIDMLDHMLDYGASEPPEPKSWYLRWRDKSGNEGVGLPCRDRELLERVKLELEKSDSEYTYRIEAIYPLGA